jgi:hypothetical protein
MRRFALQLACLTNLELLDLQVSQPDSEGASGARSTQFRLTNPQESAGPKCKRDCPEGCPGLCRTCLPQQPQEVKNLTSTRLT